MAFRTNKMPVLQEKSASGSVATFNTALAMPLPSCNIAVNAWQEGSGDPSLSNVRAIHGFSEVNTTRVGKNLCNESELIEKKAIGEYGELIDNNGYKSSQLIPIKDNLTLYLSSPNLNERTEGSFNADIRFAYYDRSGNFISRTGQLFGTVIRAQTPINTCFVRFQCGFFAEDIQFEVGSTATAYEPYVTPTIYTIQLGQEVYGAEVDIDNGVAHVTHRKEIFDGTQDIDLVNWRPQANSVGFSIITSTPAKLPATTTTIASIMSDKLKSESYGEIYSNDIDSIAMYSRYGNSALFFRITDTSLTTRELVQTWLSNNNIAVVYELATPFDIQITPTQIETLIGNNTIFADTGDVDLTFKDLDIAKRGNFREVFKLPS